MPAFPEQLQVLITEFSRLPGIGSRTAERLAFHILKTEAAEALSLAEAIRVAKATLRPCRECFNVATAEICDICGDSRRDHALVMVVEHPRDVAAFERTGRWRGVYHVLMGRLSPHDGEGPEHLSSRALMARLASGLVREVILATNPDAEGDATALHIERLVSKSAVPVSRLARGLASGGSIEYAGTEMLADALEHRRFVKPPGSVEGGKA